MSRDAMDLVFSRQYRARARRLLIVMADRANPDGGDIYESLETYAQKTGTSKRTVQRDLAVLLADGLIAELDPQPCSNGFTRKFRIRVERLRDMPPLCGRRSARLNVAGGAPDCHLSRDSLSPHRRQIVTQTSQGTCVDVDDGTAPSGFLRERLDLEAAIRDWAGRALDRDAASARDFGPIVALLHPQRPADACTLDDVRGGVTAAATSLLRRGQTAKSLKYFVRPVLEARDRRMQAQHFMEEVSERRHQNQVFAELDAHGRRDGRASRQHGADGMLAAALRVRAEEEVRQHEIPA